MHARVEPSDAEGKVYRIKVVESVAAKGEAADSHGAYQETQFNFLPQAHLSHFSN